MKRLSQALFVAAAWASATPADSRPVKVAAVAIATKVPDVKGTWIGTGEAVVLGNAPHHAPVPATDRPRLSQVEFTMNVEGQSGRRFWGTVASAGAQEPLIGVISFDGKTVYMRDSDGATEGVLVDRDTMDVVYGHSGTSMVVSANRFKRKR